MRCLRLSGWLCLAALIIAAALYVDGFFLNENASFRIAQADPLYKIFGRLRRDIAAVFYLKADEYFHGGTKHPRQEGQEAGGHGRERGGCEDEAVPVSRENKKPCDIFGRINHAVHSQPLKHLRARERAEMAPWFYMAALMDPHYIQPYVVGAYWLAMRMGRTDEAISFLKKGLRYNPQAWQIYMQTGDIYFLVEKDYEKAQAYLKRAYFFMQGEDDVSLIDIKHVLTLLSSACERSGRPEQALYYRGRLDLLRNISKTGEHGDE